MSMTRPAILLAIFLAVSALRSPAQPIPSALSEVENVQRAGGETDTMLGTGAPDNGDEPRSSYALVVNPSGAPSPFLPPARESAKRRGVGTPSTAKPSVAPTRKAQRLRATLGHALTGTSSWYCSPGRSACTSGYSASGAYAAAGPRLRAALGDWRGRTVLVTANGASVEVRLIDFCSCPSGNRLLDLYAIVFGQLARNGLSQGVVDVVVTW